MQGDVHGGGTGAGPWRASGSLAGGGHSLWEHRGGFLAPVGLPEAGGVEPERASEVPHLAVPAAAGRAPESSLELGPHRWVALRTPREPAREPPDQQSRSLEASLFQEGGLRETKRREPNRQRTPGAARMPEPRPGKAGGRRCPERGRRAKGA